MPIYRIAEINIKIEPKYSRLYKALIPYLVQADSYDFEATLDPEGFAEFLANSLYPDNPNLNEGAYIYTKICRRMLHEYDGFFFHSSCLSLDGEGYAFTALSGTGKSTHTENWRRVFGDRVVMINDDKPLFRRIDGKFYVFGTPWMGKNDIGCNMKAPLKAIYVLQRGEENRAERVAPGVVLRQLMEATLFPNNKEDMHKQLSLFNDLFAQVPVILLTCNKDEDSARVAYEAACKL